MNTSFFKFKSTEVNLFSCLICVCDTAVATGHAHINIAYCLSHCTIIITLLFRVGVAVNVNKTI